MFSSKKVLSVCLAVLLIFQAGSFVFPAKKASAVTANQFQVSSGVKYKENQEVINSNNQSIRVMEVNLLDSYTKLDLSFQNPIDKVSTTSSQAKRNHSSTNRVIGAINGSFFDMSSGIPMYLISKNNIIENIGIMPSGGDQYVNKPVAFGVDSQGKALIDYFNKELTATYKGTSYELTSINKVRNDNELILYTPEYMNGYTNTNQYGMEVVFTNASKSKDLAFGDVITGTVSQVRFHGDKTNTKIPEDGFVLSAHGDSLTVLKGMQIGDEVEVSLNIDDQWKNSQFMLGSGPMLVNNGKVEIGMDPNSSKAKTRTSRTAIAIDKTGAKTFLVTVDGGQSGYSQGMNLTEFAQYLLKLGAYKALNLDGGGSTTMLARKQGNEMATLINRPQYGTERAVTTTLQVISTAPLGEPKFLDAKIATSGEIVKGSTITVNINTLMDQYYNPLPKDSSKLKLSTTLGEVSGNTVKLTKAGSGTITASYGNATDVISINVAAEASKFSDVPSTSQYFTPVNFLTSNRIITGFSDGTYRPSANLKRVDAAILLARALKLDTKNVSNISFEDVPKSYSFYNEIAAVAGANIMKGKTATKFDPNAPLTRAEMAVILQRGFKLVGTASVDFEDVAKESFAYEAIAALVANKVTEGFDDGTFKPGDPVNRGQYALFLYRVLK